MIGIRLAKRAARKCLRYVQGLPEPIAAKPPVTPPPTLTAEKSPLAPFVCNVCGASNCLPKHRLVREDGYCSVCQCNSRMRSVIHALISRFSSKETILASMKLHRKIRGIGCSDGGYDDWLAGIFSYVNTFREKSPQLDLCNVDWLRWPPGRADFIICSDVLEHLEPPVDRAFENLYRLLKPGGAAILTSLCTLDSATREYFPDLHDWRIETTDSNRVLVNRRPDGTIDRYDNLNFHRDVDRGLEYRRFSRQGLINSVERAGFHVADIHDQSIQSHAIPLGKDNFVLVAEKPSGKRKTIRVSPFVDPYRVLFSCQEEIAARTSLPESKINGYFPQYHKDELGYWAHIPHWVYQDFRKAAIRRKHIRCLDVGCAYGTLLLYAIKSLGCEPYAIDFIQYLDPSLMKDYNINYKIANIEREAFPWPMRFDVIFLTEVLEHLNFNALPTLIKLRKLLRLGGRLYLSTPDASRWGKQTKYYANYSELPMPSLDSQHPIIDDHVWQFNESELRQLVADAGFRITRFDYASGCGKRHFNLTLKASHGFWRFG